MKWRRNSTLKRILAITCASGIMLSYIPIPVHAQERTSTTITREDEENVKVEVNMIANHRTMGFLDVGKVSNSNTKYDSDYRFDVTKESLLDLLPEYNLSDLIELEYTEDKERPAVYVDTSDDTYDGYGAKLDYLIKNNVINRTTDYIYDTTGVYLSSDRTIHKEVSSKEASEKGVSVGLAANNKYYSPLTRVSKADFISQLMKLDGVQQSRVLAIQSPYGRLSENLTEVYVDTEPLETSPYQNYMGELGLDGLNNDIIINHGVFRQMNLIATNDVIEKYLYQGLMKGLINKDEIGGVEGNKFLSELPSSGIDVPGSWYDTKPVRQMYNQVSLSTKTKESYGLYPEELEKYEESVKIAMDVLGTEDGLSYPWGNSYYYSIDECTFGNPFSKNPVEIIKRPSIVEVNNGFNDVNRQDKGYQYFKTEDLTLSEAYVYAYKFMKLSNTDTTLTQQEVDYINSAYGLDFGQLMAEEVEAVKYLIAKGVVNPEGKDIMYSATTALTNGDMMELLYRIMNKEARYEFNPQLTDLEKDMLNRGYSQSTIRMSNEGNSSNVSAKYVYNNGESISLQSAQLADRIYNASNYHYIYVRFPKNIISEENNFDIGKVKVLTNDKYRLEVEPYNHHLNGGVEIKYVEDSNGNRVPEYTTSIDAGLGEKIYDEDNRYVYVDKDGYVWGRYIVHKDSSSNIKMSATLSDGTTKSFTGFSGEGIYYLADNNTKFTKVKLESAGSNNITSSIYDKVIQNDLETRTVLQQNTSASTVQVSTKLPNYYSGNTVTSVAEVLLPEGNTNGGSSLMAFSDGNVGGLTTGINDIGDDYTAYRALYGEQTVGALKIGPYSSEALANVTYHGKNLVTGGPGNWVVNKGTKSVQDVLANVEIEQSSTNQDCWYIKYTYTGLAIDKGLSSFMAEIGMNSTASNYDTNMPSFSKMSKGEDEVTMVSKDELVNNFGIEAISDKHLKNKATGQRAFLNTDENFTLIGNNITRYDEDKLLITAAGDTVMYNLDIVLELLDDAGLVTEYAGKDIYVSTCDEYSFHMHTVKDNSTVYTNSFGNEIQQPPTVIDKTYMIYDSSNPSKNGAYVSLSALSSKASNFIFFRDTTVEGLNMLIVYYPKIGKYEDNSTVNNGLLNTMKKFNNTHTTINENTTGSYAKEYEKYAKILSKYLFTAGGGKSAKATYDITNSSTYKGSQTTGLSVSSAAEGILPAAYQYDVYFLFDENTNDNAKKQLFKDFKENIENCDAGATDMLSNSFVRSVLWDDAKITENSTNTSPTVSNMHFDVLETISSVSDVDPNSTKYFYIEPATNNLYMRSTQPARADGTIVALSDKYKAIFRNRIYASNPTGADDYSIYFRTQRYYYKTPEDCVPLEQLPLATGSAGNIVSTTGKGAGALTTKDAFPVRVHKISKYVGKVQNGQVLGSVSTNAQYYREDSALQYSFGSNILVPYAEGGLTSKDANNSLSWGFTGTGGQSDIGMFTVVDSPPIRLRSDSGANYLKEVKDNYPSLMGINENDLESVYDENGNYVSSGKLNEAYSKSTVLHTMAMLSMYQFEKRYNETYVKPLLGTDDSKKFKLLDSQLKATYQANMYTSLDTLAKMFKLTWSPLVPCGGNNGDLFKAENFFTGYGATLDILTDSAEKDNIVNIAKNSAYYKDIKQGEYFITMHFGKPPQKLLNASPKLKKELTEIGVNKTSYFETTANNNKNAYGYYLVWCKHVYNQNQMRLVCAVPIARYIDDKINTLDNSAYIDTDNINQAITEKIYEVVKKRNDLESGLTDYFNASISANSNVTRFSIFFQPSAIVPAGTTYIQPVNTGKTGSDGKPIYNYILRTSRSDRIRTEITYMSNIINSVLTRLEFETNSITYLAEVPKDSEITIGSHTLIKTSEGTTFRGNNWGDGKNGTDKSADPGLSWETCMLLPTDNLKVNFSFNNEEVNDYTLMYYLLLTLFDEKLPDLVGAEGNVVFLNEICGNGIWRLPTPNEVKRLTKGVDGGKPKYDLLDKLAGQGVVHSKDESVNIWTYSTKVQDLLKNLEGDDRNPFMDAVIDSGDGYLYDSKTNKLVVQPVLNNYNVNTGERKVVQDYLATTCTETGYLLPVISLPPTLAVEKIDGSGDNKYNVIGYINPAIYGIDMQNMYVLYLQSRDTPAESPLDVLDGIRTQNLDGDHYRDKAQTLAVDNWFTSTISFIETLLFGICMVMIFNIIILTLLVYFSPVSKAFIDDICIRLGGRDIPWLLTGGVISIHRETTVLRLIVTGILLSVCCNIFYNNLISTAIKIFWFTLSGQ